MAVNRRLAIIIPVVLVLILGIAGAAYFLTRPAKLQGDEDVYNTVTLEIRNNLFYDVRVVPNAVLESTDHSTIYSYDLLTIGVQDVEPTANFKVQIDGRWVFVQSEDNWVKPTVHGFEVELPYTGAYDTEDVDWEVPLPNNPGGTNPELLEALAEGEVWLFGGNDFIRTGQTYGRFEEVVNNQLIRMTTLFHQPLTRIHLGERLWCEQNGFIVAIVPINFNTQLTILAYGEQGRNYAAALVAGEFYA